MLQGGHSTIPPWGHSGILSIFIKLPFVKIVVLNIYESLIYTDVTVMENTYPDMSVTEEFHPGLPVGFLLLHSVLLTVESLSLLYLLGIS